MEEGNGTVVISQKNSRTLAIFSADATMSYFFTIVEFELKAKKREGIIEMVTSGKVRGIELTGIILYLVSVPGVPGFLAGLHARFFSFASP